MVSCDGVPWPLTSEAVVGTQQAPLYRRVHLFFPLFLKIMYLNASARSSLKSLRIAGMRFEWNAETLYSCVMMSVRFMSR